jgi:hypothetical protein
VSLGKLCLAYQIIIHLSSGSSRVKKLCKQNTWICIGCTLPCRF